jgi:DNA-binding NarL/FixJ family response regulator
MTGSRTSLILADDHPLVLSGVRSLIETSPAFRIVAECGDGNAALAAIRQHRPDIAVVDLKMPGRDWLSLASAVATEELPSRIVLLTAAITDSQIHTAVECGIAGIVLKDWAADTLLTCLACVAQGQRWLPPPLVTEAIEREAARQRFAADIAARLTRRELQIALYALEGHTNKQIAYEYGLSDGTVRLHLHNIFQKLGVTKRAEMANVIGKIQDRLRDR